MMHSEIVTGMIFSLIDWSRIDDGDDDDSGGDDDGDDVPPAQIIESVMSDWP